MFKEDKGKEKLILFSITLLIFIIYTIQISKLGIFYVLNDEFGYWSNAAYMAGYNWSSATSNIAYYSYGYSILLVPLFWMFDNPIHMYRAAIVMNAIMMCGSFLICYDVAKKLVRNASKYFLMTISFVIAMYPAYIVQANVAWSESMLIFVCWLITWCFIGLNNKTSLMKFAWLGFLSVYVYIIHQRALGVFISSFIVILLMVLFKKINWKQFLIFIMLVIISLVIHKYIKNDIQANNYLLSASLNSNDFVGQIGKIKALFTFEGLNKFINISLSQLFYLGAASFLLCYAGIYEILTNLKQIIIHSNAKERIKLDLNKDEKIYVYIFLLLSFMSTFLLSVIFLINPNRIDHIIYGRYSEMILGPAVLLGFINFTENSRINTKKFIYMMVGFLLSTIITYLTLTVYNFELYNLVCAASLFVRPEYPNYFNIYISSAIAIIGATLMYISHNTFWDKRVIFIITLTFICIIFIITGMSIVLTSIVPINSNRIDLMEIADYINTNEDMPIYYLMNGEFNNDSYKDVIQFQSKKEQIICINEDDLKLNSNNKYLIVNGINKTLELSDEYELRMSVNDIYLLASNKNDIVEKIRDKSLEIPLKSFSTFNNYNNDIIQSKGEEGIFMYGPYISLNSGSYTFNIEIELSKSIKEEVGYIDIVSNAGKNQHFKQEIKTNDFDVSDKLILEASLNLTDDTNNIELRAYAYKGTEIKINNIYIKTNNIN